MLKFIAIIGVGFVLLLDACSPDQSDSMGDKSSIDSVKKANSAHVSSGKFEPPDSTYTGDYFEKYPSGVIKVRGNFRFGKKSGKWMYFYPNGLLWSEAFFSSDKMNGESNVYHANGQKMYSGHYKMDIADSVWNFYDSTGKMVETRDYNKLKTDKK
ncbi:MAG: hypothetical protein Q8M29_06900 [Bacteroidota bacterium]|nr:hypothetical protein [Bacteroidota bacterium]